jgi:hypothetical protein
MMIIKKVGEPVVVRKGDDIKAALRKVSFNPRVCAQEFRELFASWAERIGEAETMRAVEQAPPHHGRGKRQGVSGWRQDRVIELTRDMLPDLTNEAFAQQLLDASCAGKVKYFGSTVRFQSKDAISQRLKRLRRRGT